MIPWVHRSIPPQLGRYGRRNAPTGVGIFRRRVSGRRAAAASPRPVPNHREAKSKSQIGPVAGVRAGLIRAHYVRSSPRSGLTAGPRLAARAGVQFPDQFPDLCLRSAEGFANVGRQGQRPGVVQFADHAPQLGRQGLQRAAAIADDSGQHVRADSIVDAAQSTRALVVTGIRMRAEPARDYASNSPAAGRTRGQCRSAWFQRRGDRSRSKRSIAQPP
jgi:hypothetical protein